MTRTGPRLRFFLALAGLIAVAAVGCAPPPSTTTDATTPSTREVPPPDGPWRPHLLRSCADLDTRPLDTVSRQALDTAWDLFRSGEGADAVAELEFHLEERPRPGGLVLLTLAQLYVMAGQGVPDVAPREGPAASDGDWDADRERYLTRALDVLDRCRSRRPDDAVVDYLAGDAERARGRMEEAAELVASARRKCSYPASFEILRRYQDLQHVPATQETPVSPVWPSGVTRGGEVVLDLLIAPDGRVAQVETVRRPGRLLGEAAAAAFADAGFEPARVGKYELWSWQRVIVDFH